MDREKRIKKLHKKIESKKQLINFLNEQIQFISTQICIEVAKLKEKK